MAIYETTLDDAVEETNASDLPDETKAAINFTLQERSAGGAEPLQVVNLGAGDDVPAGLAENPAADKYGLPTGNYTGLVGAARSALEQAGVTTLSGGDPTLIALGNIAGTKTFVLGSGNDIMSLIGSMGEPGAVSPAQIGEGVVTIQAGDGDDTILTDGTTDYVQDSAGNDIALTGSGDDTIEFGSGNDTIDGGSGFDVGTLIGGTGFAFSFDADSNTLTITTGTGATHELLNVNYVASNQAEANDFASGVVVMVSADADSNTATLYQVALGRRPDEAGYEFWLNENAGSDMSEMDLAVMQANQFVASEEFQSATEGMSQTDVINMLYQNAFGRDADPAGLAFYLGELEAGNKDIADIVADFLFSDELADSDMYGWIIQDGDIV